MSARSLSASALSGLLLVLAIAWGLWSWGPWLWPRLFPTPAPPPPPTQQTLTVDVVERAFDQALVAAGGELPERPQEGPLPVVGLPRGLNPTVLQGALRGDPRLGGASVYLTRADDLLWRLRVFEGSRLVLQRDVRPWMSVAPPHPPSNPPELVVLFDAREADETWLRRVLRWRSPVAVVLPPFAPRTLRRADEAAKASREVVAAVRPGEPLAEQVGAVPHAAAVLLEVALPTEQQTAWLDWLGREDLALIEACAEGCVDPAVAGRAGVARLRLAGRLDAEEAAAADAEVALIRNLAVQRGYGVLLADGTKAGAGRVEALLDAAKADGLAIVFAAEAARQHGQR